MQNIHSYIARDWHGLGCRAAFGKRIRGALESQARPKYIIRFGG
jgi:hypothetical protein